MSQIESQIETYDGPRYAVVAWANREKVIYYEEFGSYQGEWIMVTKAAEDYRLYKDNFGSCSGCDSFEAENPDTREKAEEFAKNYPSFAEIPFSTMRNLVSAGTLMKVMPYNVNDSYGDISYPDVVADVQVAAKLEEELPITAQDVVNTKNQEIKQRALKTFGYERFVEEMKPEVLDVDGENQLLKIDDIIFAYVKDGSTPRRYLLRVPPNIMRVKEAIAWTFGMRESEYQPLIET